MSSSIQQPSPTRNEPQSLQVNRFIIATNRGPVEYTVSRDHGLKFRRGSGGVVTALSGIVKSGNTTWVALAMTDGDRQALENAPDDLLESPIRAMPVHLRYIEVPKGVYRKHYDMMSNRVLWFTQHYLLEQSEDAFSAEKLHDAWDNGYVQVNEAIATAVCQEIERETSKAAVMLHDYHLYLVSAQVRERHPSIVMQQFIHIPWPEFRYWSSSLPTAIMSAIFQGLLGNDILGFQTRHDADNFLEGVQALLASEGAQVDEERREIVWKDHQTQVRDYPISISVTDERKVVQSRASQHALKHIQPLLREYTIMRVDRIEPTKNIVQGFHAYDTVLQQHPELHEKVTFLAFLTPSRQSLPLYRKYQDQTLKTIEEINEKYRTKDWTPIQSYVQNDRVVALTALQFYDTLLVNPVIDGMNLVAKEGPAVNKSNGVLVLSRSSGAFQQLAQASIPISPSDHLETAEALYNALMLPAEERQRLSQLAREEVERDTLNVWIEQQIRDMNDLFKTR
ncbi:MAG: trehalose-6-phosphate synthase [Ktedonobacteraceae bacterium]|nr:trehalose-6-phosphate synthase [Ktedonobacteraceae bacterium]